MSKTNLKKDTTKNVVIGEIQQNAVVETETFKQFEASNRILQDNIKVIAEKLGLKDEDTSTLVEGILLNIDRLLSENEQQKRLIEEQEQALLKRENIATAKKPIASNTTPNKQQNQAKTGFVKRRNKVTGAIVEVPEKFASLYSPL